MKMVVSLILTLVLNLSILAQSDSQSMVDTDKAFAAEAAETGVKAAFLKYFSTDSIVFRPDAVNGNEYWRTHDDSTAMVLTRKTIDFDVASNGMMGYTTGAWRLYPKGKSEDAAQFGEFVTVWEKRQQGRFLATIDITISHEKLPFSDTDKVSPGVKTADPNKRGWSVADASMNFLRMSMTNDGLAGAYKKFASDEIRLLIEREPPLLGKKQVISEMRLYTSISFPKKVALLQSADMAYTWNPCSYANSSEGIESGNCLQIWKLREKKWWIVLSVFARVTNENKPALKVNKKHR